MEAILVEYPKEDLYEDGELNQSEVDYKLLVLWKRGDIVLARYEYVPSTGELNE